MALEARSVAEALAAAGRMAADVGAGVFVFMSPLPMSGWMPKDCLRRPRYTCFSEDLEANIGLSGQLGKAHRKCAFLLGGVG